MSEKLATCVDVGRHAGRNDVQFAALVLHFHYFYFSVYLTGVSSAKLVNFSTSVGGGLYASTVLNCSHILLIISRKNVTKSSAVLPGGIGFSALFPVSLLTIWKSLLVFYLFSFIWFDTTCFLW